MKEEIIAARSTERNSLAKEALAIAGKIRRHGGYKQNYIAQHANMSRAMLSLFLRGKKNGITEASVKKMREFVKQHHDL